MINFAAMICLYHGNNPDHVYEALFSGILCQHCPPSCLIVVYDGFVSNEVCNVVDGFSNHVDIKKVFHENNLGHGLARQSALKNCDHDWIAIIDADDISLPNRFALLVEAIELNPNISVVGGSLREFRGTNDKRTFISQMNFPLTIEDCKNYAKVRSPVGQATSLINVKDALSVGGYLDWPFNEDYYLWLRLIGNHFKIINIKDVILEVRANDDFFLRRSGFKYWLSESRLQYFSYKQATTSFFYLCVGVSTRFVIQLILPTSLRVIFYRLFLRSRA